MFKYIFLTTCLWIQLFFGQDTLNVLSSQNVSTAQLQAKDPVIMFSNDIAGAAFWFSNNNNYSSFLPANGSNWISQSVLPGTPKRAPVIDMNSKGQGVITWENKDNNDLYALKFILNNYGITFEKLTQVSSQKSYGPVVSIDVNGNALIAWTNNQGVGNSASMALSLAGSDDWSQLQQVAVPSSSRTVNELVIAVNNGNGILIWNDNTNSNHGQFYSNRFFIDNTSLSVNSSVRLPTSSYDNIIGYIRQYNAKISMDYHGNAFCSWVYGLDGTHSTIQGSALFVNDSSWSSLINFAPNQYQNNLKQSMNLNGFGAVIWQQSSNNSNPYSTYLMSFTLNSNNKTVIEGPLISVPNSSKNPNIFVDKKNNIIASWIDAAAAAYYLGFIPSGLNLFSYNTQLLSTIDSGESAYVFLNSRIIEYEGVIWTNQDGSLIKASRLFIYNPTDVLLNLKTPVSYEKS